MSHNGPERRKLQSRSHPHRRQDDPPMTFWQKAKLNPFKTATAVLTFIATLASMVYGFLEFVATKSDVHMLRSEAIDVAIMKYEDDLMEIEFRVTSGHGSDFDVILVNHYKRRIESLKELKREE